MKLLKTLTMTLLLSLPISASAEVIVSRVLSPIPYVLQGEKSFKVWREVCSTSPVTVKVFKQFHNRDDGKIYKYPTPAEYEFKASTCEISIYTVEIPHNLPKGNYDYLPRIYYVENGRAVVEDIPKEIVIIK